MMNNILRSGHIFTEEESDLEIKYMIATGLIIYLIFLLSILSIFYYNMEDISYTIIYFTGLGLAILSFSLLRIFAKKNYYIVIYMMSLFFLLLIIYGYYIFPTSHPLAAWVIIQIILSYLVSSIRLSFLVTIGFIVLIIPINYLLARNDLVSFILQVAPVTSAFIFVYIMDKKFKKAINLLEDSNNTLEERVNERTYELEIDKKRLAYQAHYDELTTLPNRLFFKKELKKRLQKENKLSLFVLDLDRFKSINDIYGHRVGDKILKIISSRINKIKEKEEFFARMSGDEFIFISNTSDPKKQEKIALNIINMIEKPIDLDNIMVLLSASVGICDADYSKYTMEELIAFADIAMFEAKKEGRGRFKFYEKNMILNMSEKIELEFEMKQALKKDEFILHYQPQMDIVNHEITAIEVLIRWQSPKKGLIYPNAFILLAEEIDLIVRLDYYVLDKGLKQIVSWLKEGYALPRISFNISGKHLQNDFYYYIENLLTTTACPAKYIELEITEGYFISNINEAMNMLVKLRLLGIHIAIDDFGKGYSSLTYLKALPINKIKIDKSFIDNVHTDDVDATIVKSIINIADSLNINIVAEGVETKEQRDYLLSEGCRHIQGYYYYKPMDKEKLESEVLHKMS